MDVLLQIDNELRELGVGRRYMNDPFFYQTYKYCKVFERKGVTIEDEEELCHELRQFPCNACTATFENLLDYELHYHDSHHFICSQCNKWRPTARLLDIHVQETHDSYFKVLAEKQPMHECFVSECNVKFKDPVERRNHCREVHEFPKNYRFDESTRTQFDPKSSHKEIPMETNQTEEKKKKVQIGPKIHFGTNNQKKTFSRESCKIKIPMNSTTSNVIQPEKKISPATMFIPRQVQQKSFAKILTNDKKLEKNVLESESIMDLGDSLPSTK